MNLKRHVVLAVAFLMVVTGSLFAQTTGTLIGNATTEGVPLPGVTVTISSPQLQGTRTAVTDVNGNYKIGALPPGPYTVVFELEGMRTVTRNVNVNVSSTSRADAAMVLSAVAEAITVTATAPAVLETTEIQTNVNADLVESLPMGRSITATVNLAPGVNSTGVGGNTTISGAPSYDSVYYVDGAVVNENLRGQPQSVFIEDAIQETTVMTGGVSAEYGRFTGGVVNTITKSGGNQFEGSFRDSFDSQDWRETRPMEAEVPNTDYTEVYEGTLGGFIMRDRLWFFTAGRYFDTKDVEYFARNTERFLNYSSEETRLQGKLTGQITPNHSLVGSFFDLDRPETNYTFGTPVEESVAVNRNVPQTFWSANYSGILTSNFLVEALYAEKTLTFQDSGGDLIGPYMSKEAFVNSSNVVIAQWGARAGAPTFGNQGGDEERNSENLTVKGTYYLSTAGFGTHNIVAGYDNFSELGTSNNHQSGSDFTIYTYDTPGYNANGDFEVGMSSYNGFIVYWPVLVASQGSDFNTQSLFLNDKWDFNSQLSFNLGVRYDKNDGSDQNGATIADDSKISPRLTATYDIFGNGRVRATATYAEYVSKIAGGNVGDGASPAGSPSILYWYYGGPDIATTSTQDMLAQVWDWFASIGGVDATDDPSFVYGAANGYGTQMKGTLKSPGVSEFTIGIGSQIGTNGFVRVDYQNRSWDDFYVNELTLDNPSVVDPLVGRPIEVTYQTNSNDVTRDYDAILLQTGYRVTDRINLGAYYTWSEVTGNYTGETSGSGPVTESGSQYQPELLNYARRDPTGTLPDDRTHKLDAWVSYDLPTPVGNFNFSLLQNFDSGAPYSVAGTIQLDNRLETRCPQCRPNPGYASPSRSGTYFFSDRGEFRTEDVTRTDFALNYGLPIGPVEVFFQGEVFNIFNEDAVTNVDTTVYTRYDAQCGQACAAFDPFTETPVEGVHYIKGDDFGQPVSQFDYQDPRSWRFSAGFRF